MEVGRSEDRKWIYLIVKTETRKTQNSNLDFDLAKASEYFPYIIIFYTDNAEWVCVSFIDDILNWGLCIVVELAVLDVLDMPELVAINPSIEFLIARWNKRCEWDRTYLSIANLINLKIWAQFSCLVEVDDSLFKKPGGLEAESASEVESIVKWLEL